jgi:hypothetical protein
MESVCQVGRTNSLTRVDMKRRFEEGSLERQLTASTAERFVFLVIYHRFHLSAEVMSSSLPETLDQLHLLETLHEKNTSEAL